MTQTLMASTGRRRDPGQGFPSLFFAAGLYPWPAATVVFGVLLGVWAPSQLRATQEVQEHDREQGQDWREDAWHGSGSSCGSGWGEGDDFWDVPFN